MSSEGSVLVRVYTSDAYIPLPNAPVTFSQRNADGSSKLLAVRQTDSSGLTAPVFVTTPDASQSLSPGLSSAPYTVIDIMVSYPGFNNVFASNVQIFPGVETLQEVRLQPLLPGNDDTAQAIPQTVQNL